MARSLAVVAGGFFVLCAVLYNPWLVGLATRFLQSSTGGKIFLSPDPAYIARMELLFLVLGIGLIAFARALARFPALGAAFRRPTAEKLLLAFLVFFVPLTTLELSLRPFARDLSKETSLFVKDDVLGWRMRPNAVETWGGATVRTNSRGLRGPNVAYEKPPGVFRILYLGDSVTFGYLLDDYRQTYPFVVETMLEDSTGVRVETINAGVGGYSPWQEALYLENEGYKYSPDLVVLSFVLNDVTEKFQLTRFGGREEGYQLDRSYQSWIDRILSHSGLAYQVRNLTRIFKARRKLGSDLQLGAIRQQMLDVETLMTRPEQENVKLAWSMTLPNVEKIVDWCRRSEVPLLVVAFPFQIQVYAANEMSAPQKTLAEFAARTHTTFLDLLPVLDDHRNFDRMSPHDMFIDEDHLTVTGNRLCAAAITSKVLSMGIVKQ